MKGRLMAHRAAKLDDKPAEMEHNAFLMLSVEI